MEAELMELRHDIRVYWEWMESPGISPKLKLMLEHRIFEIQRRITTLELLRLQGPRDITQE
jgi:hypothetical protein